MRNCPVCGDARKRRRVSHYNGSHFDLWACMQCGMNYLDSKAATAQWFDGFYLTQYRTDDAPYSDDRLNGLADAIASYAPAKVLDIGGTDGELQYRLALRRIECATEGVGAVNPERYDVVILSHVLEHIYDVPAMMARVRQNMRGRLIVEVPVWLSYTQPLIYDRHWEHINKFSVNLLTRLLTGQGFEIEQSVALPDYRKYHCHRIIAHVAG